ncbi:MAG: hypothetical protein ACREQI_07325 [Candidatus Binataceae bacterium]
MEEWRSNAADLRAAAGYGSRIVESELDMVREAERPSMFAGRVAQILDWLMPPGRTVRPPKRSVARELEEAYPSRDR